MRKTENPFFLYDSIGAAVVVCRSGQTVYNNREAAALAEREDIDIVSLLSDGRFDIKQSSAEIDGADYSVFTVTARGKREEAPEHAPSGAADTLRLMRRALGADCVELYKLSGEKARRKACSSSDRLTARIAGSVLAEAAKLLPEKSGSVIKLSEVPQFADTLAESGMTECVLGRILSESFIVCGFCGGSQPAGGALDYLGAMCRFLGNNMSKQKSSDGGFTEAAKLAALCENGDIVAVTLDRDLNILDFSGGGLARLTHNPERLIGQSLYERNFPPEALLMIERALSESSGCAAIHIGERRFGAYYSTLSDGGEATGLFAVLTDITDKTMREDSAHIDSSMDVVSFSMRAGFWSYDVASGSHTWDEGCYHLWGLRSGEVPINDDVLEQIFPQGDRARFSVLVSQVMADPSQTYFHFRFTPVVIEGEKRYIETRGKVLWENGEPVKLVGMTIDITDSIELEEKLEYESGQNLTLMNVSLACAYSEEVKDSLRFTVVESARQLRAESAALYTADEENCVWRSALTWRGAAAENERFASAPDIPFEAFEQVSAKIKETNQKMCTPVLPGDAESRLFPGCGGGAVCSLISDEPGTRSMLWLGRPVGHLHWTDDETGFIMTIAGVLRMALKRGKMESDLRAAVYAAEAGNRAKSDFLSQMSHEIRTPMNAVLGMAHIAMESEDPDEIRNCLKNVEASGTHLLGIINDILDISKIEAGKMELEYSDFSLPELISNVCNMISFAAADKKLNFVRDIADNIPKTLHSDSKRLRQVLINLLNNAIKFTREGEVALKVSADKERLHFVVSDTGIGIKEEDRGRLFGAFEQLDRVANRNVSGTGLGLMISKSIVEMMNGTITLESTYGEGTTFFVDIPYEEGKTEVGETARSIRPFTTPGVKVLVVDDNSVNLLVAVGLLKKYGMVCDRATDAQSAVKLVSENDYDLVFMDHMMPEIGGIEATHMIRDLGEKYKSLPIIMLTANAIAGGREMFMAEGLDDYISKPINHDELNAVLMRHLPPDKIVPADK